jgi:hypothetical protein
LATPYREVTLEGLRSIWYRNPSSFQFPMAMSHTERQHAQHEAKLGLGGVLGALPVRWVNHPSRHADAGYKPRQLVAAAQAGLTVAPTLITNNPGAVRRVALTQRLTDTDLDDLRGIELTAHLVQRWAPKGEEARVIVIGGRVFAVAIRAHSQAAYVDWRADYNDLSYELISLPTHVEHGIRAVMRDLGLVYGAFDFVITPEAECIFLEVNPGGQFGFLEDRTDAPLTAILADLLAEEAP